MRRAENGRKSSTANAVKADSRGRKTTVSETERDGSRESGGRYWNCEMANGCRETKSIGARFHRSLSPLRGLKDFF
jgi:hypothetical protein